MFVIWKIFFLKKPKIDSQSTKGEKPEQLIGEIEFDGIEFNYPSRPEIIILKNLSLKIRSGQTIALVGASGSGKSTCIQMLQRFYDPSKGTVKLDNRDIKNLNINWLRNQLGVVNQEPILFGTTIYENIRYGCENLTKDDIIKAAIDANAHNFIMTLPKVN